MAKWRRPRVAKLAPKNAAQIVPWSSTSLDQCKKERRSPNNAAADTWLMTASGARSGPVARTRNAYRSSGLSGSAPAAMDRRLPT